MVRRIMLLCLYLGILSTVTGCCVGKQYRENECWSEYRGWTTYENRDEWRLNHPHTPIAPKSEGD